MKRLFLLLFLPFFACGGGPKEDSPSIKEAREAYARMMDIAQESGELAKMKLDEFRASNDSLIAAGDSLIAVQLAQLNSKLDSLQSALEETKVQAQEMRAHTALHEAGDEHEHHHHDHSVDYSEFSDEQLLELQVEMENQVKAIKEEIENM